MSDLVRVLRGQRIDGRGADEIMRLAADEIESLRARLAEAEKDVTRSRREWQRECEDTNLLLQGMGLCPSEYRSECGSLLLARIRHKMGHIGLRLDETLARLAEAERNEETLLGMIRHQRDVLRECLPYINESMAGRRPGRCADDIRAAVKALTADSASVQLVGQDAETMRESLIAASQP